MTSHQVRQPITNILGLEDQPEDFTNSTDVIIKMVGYIKTVCLVS